MRIGILEDDPSICTMLQQMLEINGYEVSIYNRGLDILAAIIAEESTALLPQFDALVVDLFIPGEIAGAQVIHQVKALYPDLHIIVISAAPLQDLYTIQMRYPGVKVLSKPFKMNDLLTAIEQQANLLLN
jgi:DNA-binding response OmpR family regulator